MSAQPIVYHSGITPSRPAARVAAGPAAQSPHRRPSEGPTSTHLTLEVQLVDQHGARLTLGAHQPGLSSRTDVVDIGPSWSFEASHGGNHSRRTRRPT